MKFSIVTPSFNQLPFLKQTAASVLGQTTQLDARPHPDLLPEGEGTNASAADAGLKGQAASSFSLREKAGMRTTVDNVSLANFDVEWIVIDAASTDGTVDFLKSLVDPRVKWISEKDAGQSDAINKGLKRATGDIIGWLNSDDLYASGALAAVASAFEQNPAARWAVGRYEIIDEQNRPIRPGIVRYKEKQLRRYTYRALLRENFIPQPAVFWRRDFGVEIGSLDTSLHFTMDYDLWLRMGWIHDPLFIDHLLAKFRVHARSKTGVINRKQFDEGYDVAKRYAAGDSSVLRSHRLSVEKIVWAYRLMRLVGK